MVWWKGLSPDKGRNGRGGFAGGGNLRLPPPEHSCKFHFYQSHYGPVSGGGAKDRVKGVQVVMVAVSLVLLDFVDGGLEGGTGGGRGGGDG